MIKYGNNNIGRVIFGTHEIGKAYIGSSLIFTRGIQPGPTPPGPTPTGNVSYIRNTDTSAYIDTGIAPDNTTRIIVWARNWNPGIDNHNYLFGSRVSYQSTMFGLAALNGADTGKFRIAYHTVQTNLAGDWPSYSWYHKFELNSNAFYVDDVLVGSGASGTFTGSNNIYLFGLNNNGTFAKNDFPIDICAAKIYKNNVLVRDFTAVNSPSVGFYDAVSQTLFTNAGSGNDFTYGTFDDGAFTPLDYIVCDGTQWFDTGVYGGYGMAILTKFMPTNSSAQWTSLLGTRVESPANSCDISLGTATSGQDNMRVYWRFGSNTSSNTAYDNNTKRLTNKEVVARKQASSNDLTVFNLTDNTSGSAVKTVSAGFVTTQTMYIGDLSDGVTTRSGSFIGRIYYVNFGTKNFVAGEKNNIVGMYDTYNDVFYDSDTQYPFAAPSVS